VPLACRRKLTKFRISCLAGDRGAGRDQPYEPHPRRITTANATPAQTGRSRGRPNRPVAQGRESALCAGVQAVAFITRLRSVHLKSASTSSIALAWVKRRSEGRVEDVEAFGHGRRQRSSFTEFSDKANSRSAAQLELGIQTSPNAQGRQWRWRDAWSMGLTPIVTTGGQAVSLIHWMFLKVNDSNLVL